MNIFITRVFHNDVCTMGFLDGYTGNKLFAGYSLEPPITHTTHPRIPPGTYNAKPYYSPHFKRYVIRLENVPKRAAIEIHPGTAAEDTHGCIIVGGEYIGENKIGQSRIALDKLLSINEGQAITVSIIEDFK